MKNRKQSSGMSRGRWLVERERCELDLVVPPRRMEDAVPLADAMADVLRRNGMDIPERVSALADGWRGVVGEGVAAHTRPGRLQGTHLVVYVDNSVWLNELARYGKTRLIENIRGHLGDDTIRTVGFQIDPDARRGCA